MDLVYTPTLDREEAGRRLGDLLVPGSVLDPHAARRIERVARSFAGYAACYPLPLWAPGLAVTAEMKSLTEALFPMSEIEAVFDLVLKRGCRFEPLLGATYLHSSATWLDLLQRFPPIRRMDPSVTLRELAEDGEKRARFLFALFLPRHFGAGFERYPLQSRWIARWLEEKSGRLGGGIRVLDSACGSGEGTYRVAELLRDAGFRGEGCIVHGSTVERIELFAAAHAFFPHDRERESAYRARVAPLLDGPERISMRFHLEDVMSARQGERYDLVLCNGLLGGPIMNGGNELRRAIGALAARLEPGGVLLAADRFHEGWRLRVPARSLAAIMREQGLNPLDIGEGLAAEKPRT